MTQTVFTFASGQTTMTIGPGGIKLPASIQLTSSDGTRALQLSLDNGLSFFTPTLDFSDATRLILTIETPVSQIKLTGVAADKVYLIDSN